MKRSLLALTALACLLAAPLGASLAEHTIWHSPLTLRSADATLAIAQASPSPTMRVTCTSPGDLKWVDLGLTLPDNVRIQGVILCYELASPGSFISQIRLTELRGPDAAYVIHDDGTDLTQPGPDCYASSASNLSFDGTITLSLRLNFGSTQDWIDIGGVGIVVTPETSDLGDGLGAGSDRSLTLRPNHPNPFGTGTAIEFALASGGEVELQVLDVAGRVVRDLRRGWMPAGGHSVGWDGKDDAGARMPSGTYYYRLRGGEGEASGGMLLLR